MDIGDRLKTAREERGWSQADIAGRMGMSQQKYHPYEHGREMKTSMLVSICAVLECSPNWLLGYSEEGKHLAPESLLLRQLKEAFDRLNTTGQQEAVKRVQELTHIPVYTDQVKNGDGVAV